MLEYEYLLKKKILEIKKKRKEFVEDQNKEDERIKYYELFEKMNQAHYEFKRDSKKEVEDETEEDRKIRMIKLDTAYKIKVAEY